MTTMRFQGSPLLRRDRDLAIAEDALRKAGVADDKITEILEDQSQFEYFYGSVMAVGTRDSGRHIVWVRGWGSEATDQRIVLKINFALNKPIYANELIRLQNNQFTQQLFVEFTYRRTGKGRDVVIGDQFNVFSMNDWMLTAELPSGYDKIDWSD